MSVILPILWLWGEGQRSRERSDGFENLRLSQRWKAGKSQVARPVLAVAPLRRRTSGADGTLGLVRTDGGVFR